MSASEAEEPSAKKSRRRPRHSKSKFNGQLKPVEEPNGKADKVQTDTVQTNNAGIMHPGNESKEKSKRNSRFPRRHERKLTQRRKEINELSEKYKTFAIDPEIYRVLFPPSDPDFAFPIPVIELDLHLSRHFPNQGTPPYISVLNDDIPRGNAINIESAFNNYEGTLAERVGAVDSNLEALIMLPAAKTFTFVKGKKPPVDGMQKMKVEDKPIHADKVEQTPEQTPDEVPNQGLNQKQNPTESAQANPEEESSKNILDFLSDSQSSDSDSGGDYEPEYAHSSDDEDIDSGAKPGGDTSKPKREGTELIFHDIRLTDIALCELVSLNILFQCGRCKALHTFSNLQSAEYGKSTKPRAEICSRCDLPLLVAFRKEYMHSTCHTAGYLDVDGGKVADLLPSSYVATCGQCQTISPVFKNVDMGAQRMLNCRNCHTKLWIQLELFEFSLLSTETLAPAAKKVERAKLPPSVSKQKLNLTGGEPLPNFGACEHYRKSLRWFRFSCCQRVFACDKCHDVEMQHPSDQASRMLCGYCSREQRFSLKCVYCEHDYTRRVTRFWEGGKGARDRKFMSKKDKRKYKRDPVDNRKSTTHFQGKSKEAPQ